MELLILGMAGWFVVGAPLIAGVAVASWPHRAALPTHVAILHRRTVYASHAGRIVARGVDLRMVVGRV